MATTQPSLIDREHALLAKLTRAAAARAEAETLAEEGCRSRRRDADERLRAKRQALTSDYESQTAATQREYDETLQQIESQFEHDRARAEQEFTRTLQESESRYEATRERTQAERRETRWMASTVCETSCSEVDKQLDQRRWQIKEGIASLRKVWLDAVGLLRDWRQYREAPPPQAVVSLDSALDDYGRAFSDAVAAAEARLAELKSLRLPRLFKGNRLVWMSLALWVVLLALGVVVLGPLRGLLLGTTAAVLVVAVAITGLYFYITATVSRIDAALRQSLADAERIGNQCVDQAVRHHKAERQRLIAQRDAEQQRADQRCLHTLRDAKEQYDHRARIARGRYPRQLDEIERSYQADLSQAQAKYPRLLEALSARYQSDFAQVDEQHRLDVESNDRRYEADWREIVAGWQDVVAEAQAGTRALCDECRLLFPDWPAMAGTSAVPQAAPPVIVLGDVDVQMEVLPRGISRHPRLAESTPRAFHFPALLPFPPWQPLLFTMGEAGRDRGAVSQRSENRDIAFHRDEPVAALHALMLRLLTSLPPGKVRFSIVDPVGLGRTFAAFMRLADYDEALVSKRIWTEPDQIERRLADLTEHMENVIQKYLRNEFDTIEAYNARAGEVAEPYRFLVIADFPINFNDESLRRLERILDAGPRCGVHTMILRDATATAPKHFDLARLESQSVHLAWQAGPVHWRESPFEPYRLQLDPPPATELFIRVLEKAGAAARDAKRVEIPFDVVVPPTAAWWSHDSRHSVRVPLGRVGANRLQYFDLGQGTSQHALIAGKTGSGKSTLLNVLITNVALHYSPEEIELYLVDFKKGVEFKAYATARLPHARTIAVESDREFGLSVLERLDGEIHRRGELFRRLGVQDLAAYREAQAASASRDKLTAGQASSGTPAQSAKVDLFNQAHAATGHSGNVAEVNLPRILLVVDEFQEFFVEDDTVAAEAALLLDRLVRQGRAFGIHVVLGSQTVSGAYSLARSTLSQIAVRIALESSETDAHLILSEENTAAALLSRPGEAIYNDAGGLVDGNSPFQTAWLPDAEREAYLKRIGELARQRDSRPRPPAVVFEGNVPADVTTNRLLAELLQNPNGVSDDNQRRVWLGDAVAIKEPTSAAFCSQGGSNLLIVGQQNEDALAIMSAALISLAAGQAPRHEQNGAADARFYIVDGSRVDSRQHRFFERLTDVVAADVVGPTGLAAVLEELAAEVDRRQQTQSAETRAIYLFLYDVGRFRDLRRNEDDLFSSRLDDEPAKPAELLADILREGPPVGMHTIVWCDSATTLNRTFDRAARREFDMTVLFQMSGDDSSLLIDSPQAGKLGLNRALLYREQTGTCEKFRPYALPSSRWLDWVREQLRLRVGCTGRA